MAVWKIGEKCMEVRGIGKGAKPPSLVAGGAGTRWWFRFEPGTPRSSAVCSPRLSYRP